MTCSSPWSTARSSTSAPGRRRSGAARSAPDAGRVGRRVRGEDRGAWPPTRRRGSAPTGSSGSAGSVCRTAFGAVAVCTSSTGLACPWVRYCSVAGRRPGRPGGRARRPASARRRRAATGPASRRRRRAGPAGPRRCPLVGDAGQRVQRATPGPGRRRAPRPRAPAGTGPPRTPGRGPVRRAPAGSRRRQERAGRRGRRGSRRGSSRRRCPAAGAATRWPARPATVVRRPAAVK